ncbi:MAG: OsmC family protein [Chloroflexaceae bacterium]|nr:OsmC family protein [Chloroflexaceae bacterium]NJL33976.1 OsmC family protein [Chloroflexaceae bacterium]NJO06443.1 OsmC family protein [Chloroflexaceae bacterium]
MDAKVIWQGNMAFDGVTDGTFHVPLDADIAVGGAGEGFRPMDLIALGLAGCTAMDVIAILRKKRQDVTSFEVRVHAEQTSEHPRVFTAFHVEYLLRGTNIDPKAVERAMELSETKYCPAQAMLGKVAPITLSYSIVEETPA